MKKIILGVMLAVLMIALIAPQVQAQQSANVNSYKLYYETTIVSARSYLTNTTDTIPNLVISHWAQATVQSHKLGGASMIVLRITPLDSMYSVVYVDEKIGAAWTNIMQDSILTASADSVKEFPIRTTTVEKTLRMGGEYRVRIKFPAWHTQGLPDATDQPTYTAEWLWKP
jgi:hypothetical protein